MVSNKCSFITYCKNNPKCLILNVLWKLNAFWSSIKSILSDKQVHNNPGKGVKGIESVVILFLAINIYIVIKLDGVYKIPWNVLSNLNQMNYQTLYIQKDFAKALNSVISIFIYWIGLLILICAPGALTIHKA